MRPCVTFFFLSIVLLAITSTPAQAGLILQAADAFTDMGTQSVGGYSPDNTINQSGLSTGYTSLATDFDAYIASNPTHASNSGLTTWESQQGTTTGNFDFDLGGSFMIESFALWNLGSDANDNIIGFTLYADDNSAFSNPVVLGSFTANPNTGPFSAVLPEVFSFTQTLASFVRMEITSNNGGSSTNFGEAAFEVAANPVPEPSTLALGVTGLGLVGFAAYRRRRTKA